MKFETSDTLAYPLKDVFAAFRDKMLELPKFLTNIEKITMVSREEKNDEVHQVSIWEAKVKLPGPLEKLAPQSGRTWKDIATWRTSNHTVEWRTVMSIFTEAIDVHGLNSFEADGKNTKITLRGDLTIDPKKLRGIPTILARGLVPTVERFVVSTVQKNFVEGNRAWERYFAAKKK
jgi:hypothetical protein